MMTHDPPGFVGREWLRDEVSRFQNDPARRHLIIVGEPGSGKSAFIRHLSDLGNYPRYFIRSGSASSATGTSAKAFLLSIGEQLANLYGSDIFVQPNEGTTVLGGLTIGGSEIVGRRTDRRYTLPFLAGRSVGPVTVRAGVTISSRIVGESIGEWHDFSTSVDERTLLHDCILDPLRRLILRAPELRVLILVDALDEAAHQPGVTTLDVIPRADDEQFPPNLKLLMTSRPGDHLSNFHVDDELRLSERKWEQLGDIRLYIQTRIQEEPLAGFVGRQPAAQRNRLMERIEDRSGGNFLYLFHFFNAAAEAVGAGKSLDEFPVPRGLDEIYRFFAINRIKSDADLKTWQESYLPLISTFAVLREPVTKDLLAAFAHADSGAVDFLVARLSQFLTAIEDEDGPRFALYHMDFADYLLDARRNKDFSLNAPELHRRIADYFCGSNTGPGNWEWGKTAASYAFDHLPYHVLHGYGFERLDNLVARGNDKIEWAEAQHKHFGSYLRYLDSLDLAVSAAADGPRASCYALHYSLISATIRSLSARLGPAPLRLLAATGEWTWGAVLAHVGQMPEWSQPGALEKLIPSVPFECLHDVLIAIDRIPDKKADRVKLFELVAAHWPGPWSADQGQLAIEVAERITDDQRRAYALAVLSAVLPDALRLVTARKALESVASGAPATVATKLWERVVARLPAGLRAEALTVATTIKDDWARAGALAALASHLGAQSQNDLRKRILGIKGAWPRAEGISQFLIRTPPEKRGTFPFRGLLLTRNFHNDYDHIRAVTKFLSFLPPWFAKYLAHRALARGLRIVEPAHRATVLIGLLPHLAPARRAVAAHEALAAIRDFPTSEEPLRALNNLIEKAPEPVKERAVNDALDKIATLRDRSLQYSKLTAIIPLTPEPALGKVLEILEQANDPGEPLSPFAVLAPRLPEGLLDRAQAMVLRAKESGRGEMLAALGAHPSARCRKWVLDSSKAIKTEYWRASALAAIAPVICESYPDILDSVRRLEDHNARANALVSLMRFLPPEAAVALAPEALLAAKAIPYPDTRAERLAEIAMHLPLPEQRPLVIEVLSSSKTIGDLETLVTECIHAFLLLPLTLQTDLFQDMLNLVMRQSNDWQRGRALRAIIAGFASSAPAEAQRALLTLASSLEPFESRSCLFSLAGHLTGELVHELYAATVNLPDPFARSEILSRLSRKLAGEEREKAVQTVIEQANFRTWVSAANLINLPDEILAKESYALWPRILELASDTEALTAEYPPDRFQMLWMEVAERIPQPLLADTVDTAKTVANPALRLKVLCKLAARMDAGSAVHLLNEGLAALRPRIDQLETQKLLIELAACTAEAQLTSLVAAAQWIRDDYPRALTLIRLARNAKGAPDLVRAAFDSAAALPNEGWRASAIAELAPALPDDLLPSCLRLVQAMRAHDPKTIALSALAARSPVLAGLPPVSSLLADVSRMSHEQWRAEAQINLAEVLDSRPRVDALRVALLQIARLPSWNREPLFGRALAVWASCGFADGSVTASRILADTINAIEGETRTFLLASAAMLTPVLAHVGGVDSVREGLQSVESVARWWP